jgi:hypothetical protein
MPTAAPEDFARHLGPARLGRGLTRDPSLMKRHDDEI